MNLLQRTSTRRLLLTSAAAAAGLAGVGGAEWAGDGRRATDTGREAADRDEPAAFPEAEELSFLQVIAHPDDDLYFMNPGVQHAISRGSKVTTVLLTAGEGDGVNVDTNGRDRSSAPVDFAAYSGSRHNGHRAAYALMATGRADATWRSEAVTLAGGLRAEVCTLADRPTVTLYYLNLRKGPETPERPTLALAELWSGAMPRQSTLPVPGSPVTAVQSVSRDQVLAALVGLLRTHTPSVVRTLDPDPEHDAGQPGYVVSDHHDHTAVAQFTLRAVQTYRDRTGAAPPVDHYRAYSNRFWPRNLCARDVRAKAELIRTYSGADGRPCPTHDCGDYQLGTDPVRSTHIYSTKLRHEPTTNWLLRGADGRLELYAVLAGRVLGWQQAEGGDAWSGPVPVDEGRGPGWMLPVLNAVAGNDGRVHLVGLRRTESSPGGVRLEVVHAVRAAGAAAFGPWRTLGGPDTGGHEQREVGVPSAATDGRGRLHVFVRNFAQGLSSRVERPDGEWDAWTDLGGELLQDGPTAFTTRDGRVEVYVPDKSAVRRWRQESPGGELTAAAAVDTGPVASGRVTVVETEGGELVLFYRQANTAVVRALRQRKPGRDWPRNPVALGGGDGVGPVAALWRSGRDVADALVLRLGTDLAAHCLTTGRGKEAKWPALAGVTALRSASLALGRDGAPVVAVLAADGRPRVARYGAGPGPDGAGFGPWTAL